MEINLAPGHKQGLTLTSPLLLGGGAVGYGEAIFGGIDLGQVGAIVVGPVMSHSRGGSAYPRIAERHASFVLETGLQNRGVASMLKRFQKVWERLDCPVIVQVADSQIEQLSAVVEQLTDAFYGGAAIAGIELRLPSGVDAGRAVLLIETVIRHTELPLMAKIPLAEAQQMAPLVVEAGADALVIGQPPRGLLARTTLSPTTNQQREYQPVEGVSGGMGLFPLMFQTLQQISELNLGSPLIASGGIHTPADVRQLMDRGASAFQLDSVIWVEPGLVDQIAASL